MPSPSHYFLFDVNFNFATESLFTQIDVNEGMPFPGPSGYLLLQDGTNLLLQDGENFDLN